MTDQFTISCGELLKGAKLVAFRGVEAISEPYEFQVYMVGVDPGNLDALVGESATLDLRANDSTSAYKFHGIFASVEVLGSVGKRPVVCATLVPRVWLLSRSLHSRVYTSADVPGIIKDVLGRSNLTTGSDPSTNDCIQKLNGDYSARDFVCQYRESDLAFISRWMERESMYYYFEHDESSETLVITDSASSQTELVTSPVAFVPLSEFDSSSPECLWSFQRKSSVLPGSVRLSDYDYENAPLTLDATNPTGQDGALWTHEDDVSFTSNTDGANLAKLRFQELQARKVVYRGTGTTRQLRAGYFFDFDDPKNPRPEWASDTHYLVTRLSHTGLPSGTSHELRKMIGFHQDEVYRVEVTAIPKSTQFRARRRTPWPRVYGYERAVIDSTTEGEHPDLDADGRYLVKLAFDEADPEEGKGSTRIRMMQPYAGNPEGFHFPLHKGTEVLLSFLGGDPDRPVIVGAVPNSSTPSVVKQANNTANRIETRNKNVFEMIDEDDKQTITISTPKEDTKIVLGEGAEGENVLEFSTDGDALLHTGGTFEQKIGKHKHETITANLWETIQGSKTETVLGDENKQVIGLATDVVIGNEDKFLGGAETKLVIGDSADAVVGFEQKAILGGETKFVLGFADDTVLGSETKKLLGGEAKLVGGMSTGTTIGMEQKTMLGGETKLVGGFSTVTVLGLESKTVLGGGTTTILGPDLKTVLGSVTDTVLGMETKTLLGVESKTLLGAGSASVLGVETKTILGAEMKTVIGVVVDTVLGVVIDTCMNKIENGEIKIKNFELQEDT